MRNKLIFGILFLFSLVLVSCGKDTLVDFVRIDGDAIGIVGDEINLSVTVLPEDAVNKEVSWETNDPTLATVDNGKVSLLKEGRVTISATAGGVKASHIIDISKADVSATGISINGPEEGIEGELLELTVTFEPEDTTDKSVSWSSSNPAVADVDQLGNVTLLKPGEAIIMVQQGILLSSHTITVLEKVYETLAITIDGDVEGEAGTSITLSGTVHPANATNKEISWSSSNETLATVNSNGKVTLLNPGLVIITAYQGEVNTTIEITINEEVIKADDLVVETETEVGFVGQEVAMLVKVVPENATYKDVEWTSSNTDVAKIQNGKVKLLQPGKATITFTHQDITKTLELNVYTELDFLWRQFTATRKSQISKETMTYFGTPNYVKEIFPNIFGYLFNDPLEINRDYMLAPVNNAGVTLHPNRKAPVEMIVIHDTAVTSVDAKALSSIQANSTRVASWNYTIGNDGWYQMLEDENVAWHASAGSTTFGAVDTGIPAINPWERTRLTLSDDNYYMIKGIKTNVKAPSFANLPDGETQQYKFVKAGIWPVIINGTYHIPSTRQANEGSYHNPHIVLNGGNENGIGIETSVYHDSDVWVTWGRTARLTAHLLLKFDLKLDRVFYHNSFNNKHCPNTALSSNNLENWYDLIVFEYMVQKYFSEYDIDFISHTPERLDNKGRIDPRLLKRNFVEYTLKITAPNGDVKEERFRTTAV